MTCCEEVIACLSLEYRKLIGYVLYAIRLAEKHSRKFFIQSEGKAKPIVTRTQTFSRGWRLLHAIAPRFDWFIGYYIVCLLYNSPV